MFAGPKPCHLDCHLNFGGLRGGLLGLIFLSFNLPRRRFQNKTSPGYTSTKVRHNILSYVGVQNPACLWKWSLSELLHPYASSRGPSMHECAPTSNMSSCRDFRLSSSWNACCCRLVWTRERSLLIGSGLRAPRAES